MLFLISFLLVLASPVRSDLCTQLPPYPTGGVTAFIPFGNDDQYPYPAFEPMLEYTVETHFSKSNHVFTSVMDTGSTGLAISAKDIGLSDVDLGSCEKGFEYLSSSHRLWEGCWIPANLTFTRVDVVASIPVLAVTQNSTCANFTNGACAQGSKANVTDFPTGINYVGVGFGRGSDQQPQALPNKVPFTNITSINGTAVDLYPGYVVKQTGIEVGLNAHNTEGFSRAKLVLRPNSTSDDWQMVQMSIAVDGSEWNNGQALFDTGIHQSYVRVNNGTYQGLRTEKFRGSTILQPGSIVQILVGDKECPIATYTVAANDTQNPMNPYLGEFRVERPSSKGPFINTGRNFYYSFEAMVDVRCGWFGLRHVGEAADARVLPHGSLEL